MQRMELLRRVFLICVKRMQAVMGVTTIGRGRFLVTRMCGRNLTATAKFEGPSSDTAASSKAMGLATSSSKAATDSNGSGDGGAAATSGTTTRMRSCT